MKAIDAVRTSLNVAEGDLRFFEDMRDTPLTRPIPDGNHPMWILGHLALAEGRLHQMILGETNPVSHWKPLFDWGTTPSNDPRVYPAFDDVLQTYRKLRSKTLSILDTMSDDDLDRPTPSPPPGLEQWFATVGQTLLTIASHQAFHCGQASVARRASGRSPGFVPSDELRKF